MRLTTVRASLKSFSLTSWIILTVVNVLGISILIILTRNPFWGLAVLATLGILGVAFWIAYHYPRLAFWSILLWDQFGTLLSKMANTKWPLYLTYLLPVGLLLAMITRLLLHRQPIFFPRSRIVLVLGIFTGILVFQSFNPNLPVLSMGPIELVSKFLLHMTYFILGIWLIQTEKDLRQLLWILVISGTIAGLYASYQQFVGYPSFEDQWAVNREFQGVNVYLDQDRRVLSTLLYSAAYGLFSATCALMAFPLLFLPHSLWKKFFIYLSIILAGAGVLFSLTRGVWVGIGAAIAIWAFLRWKYVLVRVGLFRILLAFVFLIAIALLIPSVRNRVLTFQNVIAEQKMARIGQWTDFWLNKMSDTHLFTGYGVGLVGSSTERYYDTRLAFWKERSGVTDNSFLFIFISTGIFGLLVFLLLTWETLRQAYILQFKTSSRFLKATATFLFLTLVVCYVDFFSSDQLVDSFPANILFWLLLAILVRLPRMRSVQEINP